MDVLFGILRAFRNKSFNSTICINGIIRKTGMLVSVFFTVCIDHILTVNLIGFIPEQLMQYLPIQTVGITEFFAILYIVSEILSTLKNMTLSGLPVKKIWVIMDKFLRTATSEIYDETEEETENTEQEKEEEKDEC